jgi:hypothetical protein
LLHTVRTKLYNIACSIRVSYEVRLDAQLLVVVCGVAPQDVNHKLLLGG